MYSASKLNKQSDNIQPGCFPFPIWNQSFVPSLVLNFCFLTCMQFSQEAGEGVWYFHLFLVSNLMTFFIPIVYLEKSVIPYLISIFKVRKRVKKGKRIGK